MEKKHEVRFIMPIMSVYKKIFKRLTQAGIDVNRIAVLDWFGHDGVLAQVTLRCWCNQHFGI